MFSKTGGGGTKRVACIDGRYVNKGKGKKGKGKGKGKDIGNGAGGKANSWTEVGAKSNENVRRKPGDEVRTLEDKFGVHILEPGSNRDGYLFNYRQTAHYDKENGRELTALLLYFITLQGDTFRSTFVYRPYFLLRCYPGANFEMIASSLRERFAYERIHVQIIQKEDLTMEDYLSGKKRTLLKLSFDNEGQKSRTKGELDFDCLKNERQLRGRTEDEYAEDIIKAGTKGLSMWYCKLLEYDVPFTCRAPIDNGLYCGKWYNVTCKSAQTLADGEPDLWWTCSVLNPLDSVDKPALRVFAYDIEVTKDPLKFPTSDKDRIMMISILCDGVGFLIVNREEVGEDIEDLEYTPKPDYEGIFTCYNEPNEKALLARFFDLIRLIGPHIFVTYNGDFFDFPFVADRADIVYTGKKMDDPFEKENRIIYQEIGLMQEGDVFTGRWACHLDCFCWVQRDSYLPMGSRGLKAVTRAKLKYDPVELDPELMTPYATEKPQELAAYSVSDAVATFYLYKKYIHDFIFALSSIIPYNPDDVLRKGSGTLCESLLMGEAFRANVVFPNKHTEAKKVFHGPTQRLVEQATYEGARVECMRVGVFRADFREKFQLEPTAFQQLIDEVPRTVDFFLVEEEKQNLNDVLNRNEQIEAIIACLRSICDPVKAAAQLHTMRLESKMAGSSGELRAPVPKFVTSANQPDTPAKEQDTQLSQALSPGQIAAKPYDMQMVEYEEVEGSSGVKESGNKVKKASYRVIMNDYPLIYHLDVGAMYPNIILSNRLQPDAMVNLSTCAKCSFNDPRNNCQRWMDWKCRTELYMATKADVENIERDFEAAGRRYLKAGKFGDEGGSKMVPWQDLTSGEKWKHLQPAVRSFSQKAYRRVKSSFYEDRKDIVCQRANPFYVDTVRAFRDRRYEYKRAVKTWVANLEKAEESGDIVAKMEANDRILLYDSLQLAHKCILNSFYGYVMRGGARWHSMELAGITTFTGSNLIREAREFVDRVGLPIELDTDGIWCMLPKSFPDTYVFELKNGKKLKMNYPNTVLNTRVHFKYTNHQYQDKNDQGKWITRPENSIFFEVDGPYKAMVLPASTDEDRMLKKRYAVFNMDNTIAELKGFEMKRRGELRLIQVFQEEIFKDSFILGTSREEVYTNVGEVANRWLDVCDSKGASLTDEEVVYLIGEKKSMSKSVDAAGDQKSKAATAARRLAEILGDAILKDSGLSVDLVLANRPAAASATERAIPIKIFSCEHNVKKGYLRRWLGDRALEDTDLRSIVDWDYYRERLITTIQKIVVIPAANQRVKNPCKRVMLPDWLQKRVNEWEGTKKQRSILSYCVGQPKKRPAPSIAHDIEDPLKPRKLFDADSADEKENDEDNLRDENPLEQAAITKGAAKKATWLDDLAAKTKAIREQAKQPTMGEIFQQKMDAKLQNIWQIVSVEDWAAWNCGDLDLGEQILCYRQEDEGPSEDVFLAKIVALMPESDEVRVWFEDIDEEQTVPQSYVAGSAHMGKMILWCVTKDPTVPMFKVEVIMKRQLRVGIDEFERPLSNARRAVTKDTVEVGMEVWENNVRGTVVMKDDEFCRVKFDDREKAFQCNAIGDFPFEMGFGGRAISFKPPRNQFALTNHRMCEVTMDEMRFQQRLADGSLLQAPRAQEHTWPRILTVFESKEPLLFSFLSQYGNKVALKDPNAIPQSQLKGKTWNFKPEQFNRIETRDDEFLSHAVETPYAPIESRSRVISIILFQDAVKKNKCALGIYAPRANKIALLLGGLSANDAMADAYERSIRDAMLTTHKHILQRDKLDNFAKLEAEVVLTENFNQLCYDANEILTEILSITGPSICLYGSHIPINQLRDNKSKGVIKALREVPICPAPFLPRDRNFPQEGWPKWARSLVCLRLTRYDGYFQRRLAICRTMCVPVCNTPSNTEDEARFLLDVVYGRLLRDEKQILWYSDDDPDLGCEGLKRLDKFENIMDNVEQHTQDREWSNLVVNNPGFYPSVCFEIDLKHFLCLAALQQAEQVDAQEGGELARAKRLRQDNKEEISHTSEVNIEAFETLLKLVQKLDKQGKQSVLDAINMIKDTKKLLEFNHLPVPPFSEKGTSITPQFIDTWEAYFGFTPNSKFPSQNFPPQVLRNAHKTAEMMREHRSCMRLHVVIVSWLESPYSKLYDRALSRKAELYATKTLTLLLRTMKRNGCQIIHATTKKVIFASGKLTVSPDALMFFQALRLQLSQSPILNPLHCCFYVNNIKRVYYGMLWMDTGNHTFIPQELTEVPGGDMDSNDAWKSCTPKEIVWQAQARWVLAEYLPMDCKTFFVGHLTNYLSKAQQFLYKIRHQEFEEDAELPKTHQLLDKQTEFLQEFFDQILSTEALTYADACESQQAKDEQRVIALEKDLDVASESSGEEDMDEDGNGKPKNVNQQLREQSAKAKAEIAFYSSKWAFPNKPGRRRGVDKPALEFVGAFTHVLGCNAKMAKEVQRLKDTLLEALSVDKFETRSKFTLPYTTFCIQKVECSSCYQLQDLDVIFRPQKQKGQWNCVFCNAAIKSSYMESRLMDFVEELIVAWQTQPVSCVGCKSLKMTEMQIYCTCNATYKSRLDYDQLKLMLDTLDGLAESANYRMLKDLIEYYRPYF